MASSSSSTASSQSPKKYDVFISFRGEDTRSNFTSHLHAALCRSKVETYIDYRLQKGDEVWPSLVEAIQDSTLFLVVFSEKYASSTWCLRELIKIFECSKDQGHFVIPVFYRIDPSHVRKQTGSYQIAFATHEQSNHNLQHVQQWRSALTQAANLSGWDSSTYRNEAELIAEIVKCVLTKLDTVYQNDHSVGLFGIREKIAHVESLLCKDSLDVRFIGIWGMGGIGKTTIAATIFNKICFSYEGFCFLSNIREESNKYGIPRLKNKLLSILLEDKELRMGMPDGGTLYAMRRLSQKKVLIVLDDVNDSEQLENLAGAHDWFGSGSRVIVTTRDKQVLGKQVDDIFEVKPLHFDEALQLFNLNAFKNNSLDGELTLLSQKVVFYAKGIPLALKILGSFLCGKSQKEWESQLEKLRRMPNTKIQHVLKLSYDGLDHDEKDIFLDIACFFKGREVEDIENFLDACGYSTTIGLKNLVDKAILIIVDDKVSMHDLIQEMGWEIVREESIEDPGKRSRLWDSNDVYEVLKYNTGTESIKGIALDMSKVEELYLSPQAFVRMRKLKFLQFYGFDSGEYRLYLPQGLETLPNELRLLHWDECPLKSLPLTFSAEKLVTFEMPNSQVRILWQGVQNLVNLRKVVLSNSYNLIELPDFSKASNLKQVNLNNCASLREIHPSILSLHELEVLFLDWCESLTSLKSDTHLKSLRHLSLYDCSRLKEFSVTAENMRHLNLAGTAVSELPSCIGTQGKLETFSLYDGRRLKNPPSKSGSLVSLGRQLHTGDNYMHFDASNLRFLYDGLRSLEDLPHNISMLSSLEMLSIGGTELRSLPASIKHLLKLRYLSLDSCRKLQSLPDLPPSVELLEANDCTSLETLQFSSTTTQLLKVNKIQFNFQNCVKLNQHALKAIGANKLVEIIRSVPAIEKCSFSNGKAEVIYPGNRVPEWFPHSTTQASITIDLSSALHYSENWGFIFCLVVPQSPSIEWIRCECEAYLEISHGEWEYGSEFFSISAMHASNFTSDHVCVWYDESFCSEIQEKIKNTEADDRTSACKAKVSLNFRVHYGRRDSSNKEEQGCIEITECGVCTTYSSEYHSFVKQTELELKSQTSAIGMGVGSSNGNKDEKEKSKEFVFPSLPTGTWKNATKGLKDFSLLL